MKYLYFKKMKKCIVMIIALINMIIIANCGGGGGDNGGGGADNSLSVKGTFTGGAHACNWFDRIMMQLSPAYALDPNSVAKVIVFTSGHNWHVVNVTDGEFSIDIERGEPAGIVFAGADNSFKGYLTLGSGLDSLPVTAVDNSIATIDLGVLTSNGSIVEPGENPLGNGINLTAEQLAALSQADNAFAGAVKNPDVDGNGQIDVLENKQFLVGIMYFVNGGSFGAQMTPTLNTPASITGYKMSLDATDTDRPDTVHFTGPAGSNLNCNSVQKNDSDGRTTYFSDICVNSNSNTPTAGEYTITYNTSTMKIVLADQDGAVNNIALVVPTVVLNGDNTINRVTWGYKTGDGKVLTDPGVIISSISLQIDGSGTPCGSYPQPGRIYNADDISVENTEHVLTCQDLLWSNVTKIYVAYNDHYGNHYVVTYLK